MGYWKAKVLPMIKKVFDKSGPKKAAAAAEACKSFEDSKEEVNKEFQEKKEELRPKTLEIYRSSSAETKAVVKERTEAGLKKESAGINKFLEELVKIDFPGSMKVSEASSKYGPVLVSGPVFFIFERVCTFLPKEETAGATATREAAAEELEPTKSEGSTTKEKGELEEEKEEETKQKEVVVAAAAPADETTATVAVTPEPVVVKDKADIPV